MDFPERKKSLQGLKGPLLPDAVGGGVEIHNESSARAAFNTTVKVFVKPYISIHQLREAFTE
jgi:ADP-ribosylglycohydrolase